MKKGSFLHFLLGIMVMAPHVNAQFNVYHPFPDSGAVWGMSTGCIDLGCGDWAYLQKHMAGDTSINGQTYKKIQESYVAMTGNGCCFPPGDDGAGYLREDTAARKVYWRNAQWGLESLLFDFTLAVGDTLKGYLFNCNPTIRTVASVDSILVGPSYRKRINMDTTETCQHFSLIEGIGSTSGLTGCDFGPFAMIGTALNCFTIGGDVLYTAPCDPPDLIPCGTLPTTIEDAPLTGRKVVRLSPNPTNDQFEVELNEEDLPVVISIFDIFGNELMREPGAANKVVVDVSGLAAGTYFIRLSGGGGTWSFGKVIKQ